MDWMSRRLISLSTNSKKDHYLALNAPFMIHWTKVMHTCLIWRKINSKSTVLNIRSSHIMRRKFIDNNKVSNKSKIHRGIQIEIRVNSENSKKFHSSTCKKFLLKNLQLKRDYWKICRKKIIDLKVRHMKRKGKFQDWLRWKAKTLR
jgi:hypothetical protein